jgi:hypothetical protein
MVIINNQLKVAKLKLTYIIGFFLGTGLIIPFFVTNYITSEYYAILVIGILLLLYVVYLSLVKPEYIYMAEVKDSLQIKNYPARPILRTYKAYEIKLNTIHHFEISKTFYNKTSLSIWVKTKKGTGSYPPLSLSALSKNEQLKLSKYLSKHTIERRKNVIPFK